MLYALPYGESGPPFTLIKADGNGNVIWRYEASGTQIYPSRVETDSKGNIFVTTANEVLPEQFVYEGWKFNPLGELIFRSVGGFLYVGPRNAFQATSGGVRLFGQTGETIWEKPVRRFHAGAGTSDGGIALLSIVDVRTFAIEFLSEQGASITERVRLPEAPESEGMHAPKLVAVQGGGVAGVIIQRAYENFQPLDRVFYFVAKPGQGAVFHRLRDYGSFYPLIRSAFGQVYVVSDSLEDDTEKSYLYAFDARIGGNKLWEFELTSNGKAIFQWLEVGPYGTVAASGMKSSGSVIQVFRQTGFRDIAFTSDDSVGGRTINAAVSFFGKSPLNRTVLLSSSSLNLTVPPSTVVAAGRLQVTVPCVLSSVISDEAATITARCSGVARTATIMIKKTSLAFLGCAPSAVVGGADSTGVIRLFGPASAGGFVVKLLSDGSEAVVPVGAIVPAGSAVRRFTIRTLSVSKTVVRTLTASANGVSRTSSLTIRP